RQGVRCSTPTDSSSLAPVFLAFPHSSSALCSRVRRVTRPTIAALLASALLGAASANAASLFDPSLRFRQLRTEHFVIYFHQGEGRLAQRLGSIAEETWRLLRPRFSVSPPPLTRVILADQTELWNGYATPLPRDTIVIYAVWPSGSELAF